MGPIDRMKKEKRAAEEKKRQEQARQAASQEDRSRAGPQPEGDKPGDAKASPVPQNHLTKQNSGQGKKPKPQLELPDGYKKPEPETTSKKSKKKKNKKKSVTNAQSETSDSDDDDTNPKDPESHEVVHRSTEDPIPALSSMNLSNTAATPQVSFQSPTTPRAPGRPSQTSAHGRHPTQSPATNNPQHASTPNLGSSRDTTDRNPTQEQATHQLSSDSSGQTPSTPAANKIPLPRRPQKTAVLNPNPSGRFLTNHFKFAHNYATWYRYTSSINPAQTKKGKIRLIYSAALHRHPVNGMTVATDYGTIMIAASRIPEDSQDIVIQVRDSDIAPGRVREDDVRNQSYSVKIVFKEEIPFLKYAVGEHNWEAMQAQFNDPDGILQAVNIVVSHGLNHSGNIKRVGQQKYYPLTGDYAIVNSLPPHIGNRRKLIDAIRGFSLSAKGSKRGILINANVTTGAFWKDGILSDAIRAVLVNGQQLNQLKSTFSTVRVSTDYRDPPHRDYHTITGFSQPRSPGGLQPRPDSVATITNFRFQWTNGQLSRTDTVKDYVLWRYNKALAQIDQHDDWAVQCGVVRNNPVFIPSQLCRVEPSQPYRGSKTAAQNADMIKVAELTPGVNQGWLRDNTVPCINSGLQQSAFGRLVENNLLEVEYQVLKAPTLYYGKNNEHVHKNGSWNLTGRQFQNPLTMPEWGCIWIQNTQLTDSSESDMVSVLQQINQAMNLHGLKGYRMHLPNKFRDTPRMSEYDGDGISEALKDYSNKKVKLVIVIAGKKLQLSTYSALKSLADIKLGLHMACVVPRFRKDGKGPQEDMFSNLVAKINLKLGGATHILYNGSEARENRNAKRGVWVGTMFVGIDTSHPSIGSADDAPTIAAVVANYHDNCVQWPASIRRQQGKKEIVADMKQMMKERLAKWKAMNGQRDPQRIVVYRDGVSEGQYQEVLRTELVGMQGAVGETCSTAVPITLMIATKRHHTRFFLKGEAKGNPDPGTVVDSGITLDTVWDFFLQSHSSPLGTAKSTRYVIIHHDTGNQSLSATKVQEITFELCYLYGKASKSLSICPPAHYAHLACERGRRYLNPVFTQDPNNNHILWQIGSEVSPNIHANVRDSMFYL